MRILLAVLDRLDTAHPVLAAAGLVARRLPWARIDVLHVRAATDPGFMPTEEVMTPQRQAQFEATTAALAADLREVFDAWRRGFGQAADVMWREESGEPADIVGRDGRKADLVVIGRAARHPPGDGHAAIEAALFAAGAPVLLVPKPVPTTLGAHIAVAWKPGEAAERAIVAATPLLRAAARVTVLIGAETLGDTKLPEVLVRALVGRTAVPVPHPFALAGEPIGPALLREARLVGADLLVMGAYAHRRSVEAMLGGATRDILASTDLPVFLHH